MTHSGEHPAHGGDLAYATRRFGTPTGGWQDLSTGISPWAYPVGEVPAQVWRQLPVDQSGLIRSAAAYYGADPAHILPVPGSQFALARLPALLEPASVALPRPGYEEHARHWLAGGHTPLFYRDLAELREAAEAGRVCHAVVINPNNPTGERVAARELLALSQSLPGILLVDEAFADLWPSLSVAAAVSSNPRLYVLRSVGKFFGLAGVRLGFLLGSGGAVAKLHSGMDPWAVSTPALWVGERALADRHWQISQRQRISEAAQALSQLLANCVPESVECVNSGLFVTLHGDRPYLQALFTRLGHGGIFSRWCYSAANAEPAWLRLGLPVDKGRRLTEVLCD